MNIESLNLPLRILYATLPFGIATRASLMCCGHNQNHVSITLREMLAAGLLDERHMKVNGKPRAYNKAYLAITPAGFDYFAHNCGLELFSLLPYDDFKFSLRNGMSNERLRRLLAINDAAIPLTQLGCTTATDRLLQTPPSPNGALSGILRDIFEEYQDFGLELQLLNEPPIETAPRFYSSLELLPMLHLNKHESSQYAYSSHVGALVTQHDSYMIYRSGKRGMSWQSKGAMRYSNAAGRALQNVNHVTHRGGLKSAILLVKNAREFEHAVLDPYGLRATGADKEQALGYPYENMFVVPVKREGLATLRQLIDCGTSGDKTLADRLTENRLERNVGSWSSLLPYTINDRPVFHGALINLPNILKFQRYLQLGGNPEILCHKWQTEYYKRIFPNAVCHEIVL